VNNTTSSIKQRQLRAILFLSQTKSLVSRFGSVVNGAIPDDWFLQLLGMLRDYSAETDLRVTRGALLHNLSQEGFTPK
jgi:hypothetical protein